MIITPLESQADGRLFKRKRIKCPFDEDVYIDIPVLYGLRSGVAAEQHQDYRLYFDNSARSSRQGHAHRIFNATELAAPDFDPDTNENYVVQERVDSFSIVIAAEQYQEKPFYLTNTDPPPKQADGSNTPAHQAVHYVRFYKDNDDASGVYLDIEIIDELHLHEAAAKHQDWRLYFKHYKVGDPVTEDAAPFYPTKGWCDPNFELAPDESQSGIDPPYRLDPLINIVNVSWQIDWIIVSCWVSPTLNQQSETDPETVNWIQTPTGLDTWHQLFDIGYFTLDIPYNGPYTAQAGGDSTVLDGAYGDTLEWTVNNEITAVGWERGTEHGSYDIYADDLQVSWTFPTPSDDGFSSWTWAGGWQFVVFDHSGAEEYTRYPANAVLRPPGGKWYVAGSDITQKVYGWHMWGDVSWYYDGDNWVTGGNAELWDTGAKGTACYPGGLPRLKAAHSDQPNPELDGYPEKQPSPENGGTLMTTLVYEPTAYLTVTYNGFNYIPVAVAQYAVLCKKGAPV